MSTSDSSLNPSLLQATKLVHFACQVTTHIRVLSFQAVTLEVVMVLGTNGEGYELHLIHSGPNQESVVRVSELQKV